MKFTLTEVSMRHSKFGSLWIVGLAVLGACVGQIASAPEQYEVVKAGDDHTHIMNDGGGSSFTRDTSAHWVGVQTPGGSLARFVCPGIPRAQTDRMLLEYLAALRRDPPSGANQQT